MTKRDNTRGHARGCPTTGTRVPVAWDQNVWRYCPSCRQFVYNTEQDQDRDEDTDGHP